ncbi:MAG: hypothetical protein PHR60_08415, partial [Eubacteriales bacterium]|nr:hypothetical protein [Eubacteriales bacterium]
DAFGVVALVTMTPLITVQVMGIIYKIKLRETEEEEEAALEMASALEPDSYYIDLEEKEEGDEVTHGTH